MSLPNTNDSIHLTLIQSEINTIVTEVLETVTSVVPSILFGIAILIIGFAIGRLVDNSVYDIAWRSDLDKRASDTPVGRLLGKEKDVLADALGTISRYIVYAVALSVAVSYLGITQLSSYISLLIGYVPNFTAGVIVLLLGLFLAHLLQRGVTTLFSQSSIGESFDETLVGEAINTDKEGLSVLAGYLVTIYVYLLTLYTATSLFSLVEAAMALRGLLRYFPVLVGAIVLVVIGALIAEFAGRKVDDAAISSRLPVATVTHGMLISVIYLFTAIVALSALGVSTDLLITLLLVTVFPITAGMAIAFAIAFGYGGRDPVSSYLEQRQED